MLKQLLKATRRAEAAGTINLAHRRAWFADGDGQEAQGGTNGTSDDGQVDLATLPKPVQDYIKSLRNEAATRRKELDKFQSEASQREQERLKEEGRWKELAEKRERDLAALTPFQQRAQELETMIRAGNEARINRVPEDMRTLIPVDYPPERLASWLDANWERLTVKPAPNIDAGAAGGSGSAPIKLTQDELDMAQRLGLTPDAYAKRKGEIAKRSTP